MQTRLMAPDHVQQFAAAFIAETNRLRGEGEAARAALERDYAQVSRRIAGLIDAIADGLRTPGIKEQLEELERRKAELEHRRAEPALPLPHLHPNLAELYRAKVAGLRDALADPACRTEATELIRALIERVNIRAIGGKAFDIELTGDIAAMLELGSESRKAAPG